MFSGMSQHIDQILTYYSCFLQGPESSSRYRFFCFLVNTKCQFHIYEVTLTGYLTNKLQSFIDYFKAYHRPTEILEEHFFAQQECFQLGRPEDGIVHLSSFNGRSFNQVTFSRIDTSGKQMTLLFPDYFTSNSSEL